MMIMWKTAAMGQLLLALCANTMNLNVNNEGPVPHYFSATEQILEQSETPTSTLTTKDDESDDDESDDDDFFSLDDMSPELEELAEKLDNSTGQDAAHLFAEFINESDTEHIPELHKFAQKGDLNNTSLLIKQGKDINEKTSSGKTPLHFAAEENQINIASFLLEQGASSEAAMYDSQTTPLHHAVIVNHIEMVTFLTERGANASAIDKFGRTPLHIAVLLGNIDIVTFLVESRNISVNQITDKRKTPLMLAIDQNHAAIANYFLANNANISCKDKSNKTVLHLAAAQKEMLDVMIKIANLTDVNIADKSGDTPLHYCAMAGNTDACCWLLKNGAKVNAVNKRNETALQMASSLNWPATEILLEEHSQNHTHLTSEYLGKILTKSSLSAINIKTYVDYVLSLGKVRDNEEFKKVQVITKAKKSTLVERLDESLDQAQTTAGMWSGILDKIQTGFIDIDVFGQTFVDKMFELDAKVPGFLEDLSEDIIIKKVVLKKMELRIKKISPLEARISIKKFEKDLRSSRNNIINSINRIKDFIDFTAKNADKHAKTAHELVKSLRSFKEKLSQDRVNFQVDIKHLVNATTEVLKNIKFNETELKTLKESEMMENKFLEGIIKRIDEIQETQRQKSMFFAALGVYRTVTQLPGIATKVKNAYKWNYLQSKKEAYYKKNGVPTLQLRNHFEYLATPEQKEAAKEHAKQSWNKNRVKTYNNKKEWIKNKIKSTKKGKKLYSWGKKAVRGGRNFLSFVSFGADIVTLVLSIQELVNHKSAAEEWAEIQKNHTESTKKLLQLNDAILVLNFTLTQITMSTELKDHLMYRLENLEKYADAAILEAEILESQWNQMALNLGQLHNDTVQAEKERSEDMAFSIRTQLRRMYQSWKEVFSAGLNIRAILTQTGNSQMCQLCKNGSS